METARVFKNAEARPVAYRKNTAFPKKPMKTSTFKIIDGMVILIPKGKPWEHLRKSLNMFTEDFMKEREQPPQQKRETFSVLCPHRACPCGNYD